MRSTCVSSVVYTTIILLHVAVIYAMITCKLLLILFCMMYCVCILKVHSNYFLDDLSKGCSSGDLVCDDKPGDPKSSVCKDSRNPDMIADGNGHVVDKNHCSQSESSCERVGSTSRDATKLIDNNHVQNELAVIVAIRVH